jgi:methyl coenzyme M reductase subunit D
MKPNKRKTARAVAFRNFGIPFTYTIESTFGVMRDKQVLVEDFIKIGEDVLKVSNDFLSMTCLGN